MVGKNGLVIDQCACIRDTDLNEIQTICRDIEMDYSSSRNSNSYSSNSSNKTIAAFKNQFSLRSRVEIGFGDNRDLMNEMYDRLLEIKLSATNTLKTCNNDTVVS